LPERGIDSTTVEGSGNVASGVALKVAADCSAACIRGPISVNDHAVRMARKIANAIGIEEMGREYTVVRLRAELREGDGRQLPTSAGCRCDLRIDYLRRTGRADIGRCARLETLRWGTGVGFGAGRTGRF